METSMPQAASSTSVGFNAATGTDAPIRALVLCSGGVDSTTLLAMAVKRYGAQNVYALSISYGQRHDKEIFAAQAVAGYYGVEQRFLDLSAIFADSNCSLLAHSTQDVPEECYAEQLSETDGKPVSTYVPLRNGLFLSSAAPFVQWSKADIVRKGLELEVPYELTWSCYEGGEKPCGVCGTCIDRIRAFNLNGVTDPLMQ